MCAFEFVVGWSQSTITKVSIESKKLMCEINCSIESKKLMCEINCVVEDVGLDIE